MDFKKDRITLSFNEFNKYLCNLNIDVNMELLNLLCHKDYIITNNKKEYICKLKYSEERIKKAKIERLKKRDNYKLENINLEKNIPRDNLDELFSNKTKINCNNTNKNIDVIEKPIEDNIYNKEIINNISDLKIQTARSSSYLFDEPIIDEIIVNEIPENILDIYDELEIKDQVIDNLEDSIKKFKKEIDIRDKKIYELIKEIDKLKLNNNIINKKDLITYFDNILLNTSKLNNYINSFIFNIEEASPKKIKIIANKEIITFRKNFNEIDNNINLINKKISELLI